MVQHPGGYQCPRLSYHLAGGHTYCICCWAVLLVNYGPSLGRWCSKFPNIFLIMCFPKSWISRFGQTPEFVYMIKNIYIYNYIYTYRNLNHYIMYSILIHSNFNCCYLWTWISILLQASIHPHIFLPAGPRSTHRSTSTLWDPEARRSWQQYCSGGNPSCNGTEMVQTVHIAKAMMLWLFCKIPRNPNMIQKHYRD